MRHVGELFRVFGLEGFYLFYSREDDDLAGVATSSPFHLGVSGVPDQDQLFLLVPVALRLLVHLRHKRAGSVDDAQAALFSFFNDLLCDAALTLCVRPSLRAGSALRTIAR